MPRIAFIGAGSFGFTRKLVKDVLSFPAFQEATLSLMDIDEERLEYIRRACEKIVTAGGYGAKIEATTDRRAALEGADGVVITILSGGLDVWRHDLEIPAQYGVDINIGDTRGPAGIFRALRTIPVMLDILRDIESVCPGATVLNYTNPMAMLIRAMQEDTSVTISGLCHSVQGTASMLARWIGAPEDEITYTCAGINHQAWYLDFLWNGRDAYPLIREAVAKPEIYNEEQVRNEMFLHLDYYVTESSGHASEYVPWFRKRPDLIEKYCTHGTGWNPGHHAAIITAYERRAENWRQEIEEWIASEEIDLARGQEYAAYIFNAVFGDNEMFTFNGNVRNTSLIDNLPPGCCVEVPVLASRRGLEPIHVGPLPDHLAIINNTSARCEELTVAASLEGDPRKVFHAVAMDPLTSAVLSLAEIKEMTDRMMKQNADYLPQFPRIG
ncbi:MAG: alpha-galactosidase [Spirochaetota bacterium]